MKSAAKNIQIASYDDLFKTDAERQADAQERVQSLLLDQLVPFPNHPFKVLDDDKMLETVESIRERGVLVPILVRPQNDGTFQIVSGHRGHHASLLAGKTEIPAIVRDMDDDTAILLKEQTHPNADGFAPMMLAGVTYAEKKEAGAALLSLCQNMLTPDPVQIGVYRGLTLELSFDSFSQEYRLAMIGQLRHTVTLGTDVFGNIQRMDNALDMLPVKEQTCREHLSDLQGQLKTARVEVQKPFPREEELKTKTARLEELNALLNMDNRAPVPEQEEKTKRKEELER